MQWLVIKSAYSENDGVLNLAKTTTNRGQNNSRILILNFISWFLNRMILNLDQNYCIQYTQAFFPAAICSVVDPDPVCFWASWIRIRIR